MRDPFIAEIRRVRAKMAKELARDPEAFKASLKAAEDNFKGVVVDMNLRPIARKPKKKSS